jgi:hypothetical protein
MKVEIKASITVSGEYGSKFLTIKITEEDLIELAKKKALENFEPSYYDKAEYEEMEITTNL